MPSTKPTNPKLLNPKPTNTKMTLYLIGTGLNTNSLTLEALNAIKNSDKIYLETYTVDFPYPKTDLENEINTFLKSDTYKLTPLSRENVENESLLQEAKTKNVSLLIYGDCLSATTHMQLIISAKQQNIPIKIIQNTSIMTAVAQTGLSLYKFGKTTSMPNWQEHTNHPTSFINYIQQNQSIQAHTLILTDIGLTTPEAIKQLQKAATQKRLTLPEKIIIISNAGTPNQQVFHDTPNNLSKKNINLPFCIIIPSDLSHTEVEALQTISEQNPSPPTSKSSIILKSKKL